MKGTPNVETMDYIKAERGSDGGWRLFFRGTQNEVWPDRVFANASSARRYAAARLAAEKAYADIGADPAVDCDGDFDTLTVEQLEAEDAYIADFQG
jgi:hypothetical protein